MSPKHEAPVSHRENPAPQVSNTHTSETSNSPTISEEVPAPPSYNSPPLAVGVAPKIGLILGPGALRSYAHVGVVQELVKQRMPIHAIVGIEMGALVAAIYANKGQPYDVEWQMMKLKEPDLVQKGLLSSQVKAGDVASLHDFINLALSSARAENSKVPFACPALQMEKQQVYLMSRGAYSDMLPYCLTLPPLFRPYQKNVAGVFSLRAAIDHLRAKGATYIVYVDLLSGPVKINGASEDTQVLWSLAAETLSRPEKGLDYVIHVPLKEYDLLDFSRRREMIQKGQQSAVEAISKISKSLNL
jgi:NTE family protein